MVSTTCMLMCIYITKPGTSKEYPTVQEERRINERKFEDTRVVRVKETVIKKKKKVKIVLII